MTHPKRGLGRGLDALISARAPATSQPDGAPSTGDITTPGPTLRRGGPDPLREHGILQPLIVTRDRQGGYRLIAGERRLQAARLAGLESVPVVIREAADAHLLELALIENIQRADLNAIEEANAYRRLVDEYHLTQEDVARGVGKNRKPVANR